MRLVCRLLVLLLGMTQELTNVSWCESGFCSVDPREEFFSLFAVFLQFILETHLLELGRKREATNLLQINGPNLIIKLSS